MPSCEAMADNNDKSNSGNGTGVFIPQCILDGSALTNPAIFNRPQRKRRGSGHAHQSDVKHSSSSKQNQKQQSSPQQQQQQQQHAPTSAANAGTSSGTASAKNPFAATPRNIRQQQLLCNLVAAADCFSEATGAATLPPTASRGPSLDVSGHANLVGGGSGLPPPSGGCSSRASTDMVRSGSRTSLDTYHYQRSSIDMRTSMDMSSARPSIDLSSRSSVDFRPSVDRFSLYSSGLYSSARPSSDSTFSCFAAGPGGRGSLDLGGVGAAVSSSGFTGVNAGGGSGYIHRQPALPGSTGRSALDLGHRPSLDVRAAQQHQQQRCSMDMSALAARARMSVDVAPGAQRISLDNSDCSEALVWQQMRQQQQQHQQQHQQQQQQQRSLVRRENSNLSSNSTMSSTASSMEMRMPSPTGAAASPEVMAAAALAAQQAAAAVAAAGAWDANMQSAVLQQLQQQLLLEQALAGHLNTSAAGGVDPAQILRQISERAQGNIGGSMMSNSMAPSLSARLSGWPASNRSSSDMQHELGLIQQQLQHIVQANQIAAAAATAAASRASADTGAAHLNQAQAVQLQQQMHTAVLQRLLDQQHQQQQQQQQQQHDGLDAVVPAPPRAADPVATASRSSSLDVAVSAGALQQQLEMLQMLQL